MREVLLLEGHGLLCRMLWTDPMSLKLGVFSTASVDNIDAEIQSSLSTTSLHGTAASINQHPTEHNQGQPREKIMLNQNVLKLRRLPD